MVSRAGDKAFFKINCVRLAKRNPKLARLNADSFMFYAMQSGIKDRDHYRQISGGLYLNEGCKDRYWYCWKQAKEENCCADLRRNLHHTCCASCQLVKELKKCGGKGLSLSSLVKMSRGVQDAELALEQTGIYDPGFTQ